MDKWQFMNLSSMRFDLDGVNVNTRPIINEFVQDVEIMCKSLGYSITLKREDDNMGVTVHAV